MSIGAARNGGWVAQVTSGRPEPSTGRVAVGSDQLDQLLAEVAPF